MTPETTARPEGRPLAGDPGWVDAMTLGEIPLRTARERPEAEALVFPGLRLTYAELSARVLDKARSLSGLGVRRGDRVGVLMPNSPEVLATVFAASLLGAVVVPVNTRFRVRELEYVIARAGVSVLVTSDVVEDHVDFVARLGEAFPGLAGAADPEALGLPSAPALRAVVLLGRRRAPGFVDAEAFAAHGRAVPEERVHLERLSVRLRDVALILFTSGTTAHPKGCMLTHEALVRVWSGVGRRLGIGPAERVFDPLPLFHLGGLGPAIFTLGVGATLISMFRFEGGEGLDLVEAERATWLYTMFPPVTMGLIRHPTFAGRDLEAVRAVMTVAPVETLEVIRRAFPGADTMCGPFGMTEAGGAITCHDPGGDPDEVLRSSGPPLPGVRVRATDPETGETRSAGVVGELLVHTPGALEGYLDDPEQTAATLDAQGWIHSGDLGTVDERGWVTYTGRLKEMIKVGGENVSPLEVEAHLSTHPAVKLVVVVGVPDERLGEVPAAFVEIAAGHRVDEEEIVAFCRGAIAGFRVPRYVRFVTDWPMSATKVQRPRLRERLVAELEGARS